MWTFFLVSLLHMAGMAISPALNQMKTVAFPQYDLVSIQTALALSSLTMPCVSLLSAAAIRRGFLTKKSSVALGLFSLGLTGILSLFLNGSLWHLRVLAILTGFGSGCYLTTSISIMMDRFDADERRKISGYQSVFVNAGAILAGVLGGLLASWRWHGGYLFFLVGIPLGVLTLLLLPEEKRTALVRGTPKQVFKIKPIVFYYTAVIAVFMLSYAVVGGNLAVHMAASGVKSTAVVGTLTSFQMVGGAVFGFFFGKSSVKFRDYLITGAFLLLFVGMTILNIFHSSLVCAYIGVFLAGISITMIGPQCIVSASDHVNTRSSALASSLLNGLAPGFGGFLSPIVFTSLTDALVKDSTNFRYQFVAFFALACAAAVTVVTRVRAKKNRGSLTEAVCKELS